MPKFLNIKLLFLTAIFFFGIFGLAKNSWALEVTATNLNLATVQAAVNQVYAAGGGTVYLPAGNGNWSNGAVYVPGGVNIIGYGSPMTSRDSNHKWTPLPTTIINSNTGATTIQVNASGQPNDFTKSSRIANIEFRTTYTGNFSYISMLNCPQCRIDHCDLQGNESAGAVMYQVGIGCQWSNPSVATTGVMDHCNLAWGDYGVHVGPRLWIDNKPLGTSGAWFIEDSYLENFGHPISGLNGASWVFRNNYVTSTACPPGFGYGIDVHGPYYEDLGGSGAGQYHGANTSETYNNYFDSAPNVNNSCTADNWGAERLRSGRGVIWGNTFKQQRHAVIFTEDSYGCNHCSKTTGTSCTQDSNCPSGETCGLDYPHSFWFWNNTLINVSEQTIWNDGEGCSPTYINLTTSCNPLASNAICVDNTTAMPGYTPYTYPHPLQGAGNPDITPPAAPTGVTIL